MANQMQAARTAMGTAANLYGRLLPDWIRGRAKDFFSWVVDWEGASSLAAGATTPRTFQVDQDADAYIVAVGGAISDAGAFTLPVGATPVKLTIRSTGSGRELMSAAVMWDTLVGSGQLPGFLAFPKLIPRASTVTVTAQNLDAANPWDVHLTFTGFKIFTWAEEGAPE